MNALSPVEVEINDIYRGTILEKGVDGIPEFEKEVASNLGVHFPPGFVSPSRTIRELTDYVEGNRINLSGIEE